MRFIVKSMKITKNAMKSPKNVKKMIKIKIKEKFQIKNLTNITIMCFSLPPKGVRN